jgi:hypothetical protein
MSNEAWALIFMMIVLKVPIVYLGMVVWYAIRAVPEPGASEEPETSIWRPWARRPDGRRPRRGGPHGTRSGPRQGRASASAGRTAAGRGRVGS